MQDGASLAWLHEHGEVVAQSADGDDMLIDVRLPDSAYARFLSRR